MSQSLNILKTKLDNGTNLKKSLKELREEYNIELFPVNEIPAGKYLKSALPAD